MEVVDVQKLQTAIQYLQRITEGKNPVNNMPVDDDSIINNPNVERCMLFVKEVLEELKRNDGYIGRRPRANKERTNAKNDYPLEALELFKYVEDKSLTKFARQLNELIDQSKCKKLGYSTITRWLAKNGYLTEGNSSNPDNRCKIPTKRGMEIGIRAELRHGSNGYEYYYVTYGKSAQEFIVHNMAKILNDETLTLETLNGREEQEEDHREEGKQELRTQSKVE